jgi:hypothetical protein
MTTAFDFEADLLRQHAARPFRVHAARRRQRVEHAPQSSAFDWVDILPGKAVDPKSVDLSTTLLGTPLTRNHGGAELGSG